MNKMTRYIDRALAEWDNGFSSKASKKRALDNLNRAYDAVREEISNFMLRVPREERDNTWNKLYWELPFNLYQWKAKHNDAFLGEGFEKEVKEIKGLIEYREAIKSTEVVPPFKAESPEQKTREEIESYLHSLYKGQQEKYVNGVELADKFGGLHVTANAHWVTNQHGTVFTRHFFYLFGKLTALNTIIAVAQQHKENNKKGV